MTVGGGGAGGAVLSFRPLVPAAPAGERCPLLLGAGARGRRTSGVLPLAHLLQVRITCPPRSLSLSQHHRLA